MKLLSSDSPAPLTNVVYLHEYIAKKRRKAKKTERQDKDEIQRGQRGKKKPY
jgi:hypothetical protein